MSLQKCTLLAFVSLFALQSIALAGKKEKVLNKTEFDPDARQVDLFTGVDDELIKIRVVARDSTGGNLLITNKLSEPISIQVPESFVAVPVSSQMGMGGMGGMGMGGGMGGMGGGMGGMGGGMGGMGGGMGMFSIPAERTVRIPFNSVCMNHGLEEPHPQAQFKLVRTSDFSNDPTINTLLSMVGTGKLNQAAAQAATWNLSSGMTWQQLSMKTRTDTLTPSNEPYFHPAQLMAAQNITMTAHNITVQRLMFEEAQRTATEETPATTSAPERVFQTK